MTSTRSWGIRTTIPSVEELPQQVSLRRIRNHHLEPVLALLGHLVLKLYLAGLLASTHAVEQVAAFAVAIGLHLPDDVVVLGPGVERESRLIWRLHEQVLTRDAVAWDGVGTPVVEFVATLVGNGPALAPGSGIRPRLQRRPQPALGPGVRLLVQLRRRRVLRPHANDHRPEPARPEAQDPGQQPLACRRWQGGRDGGDRRGRRHQRRQREDRRHLAELRLQRVAIIRGGAVAERVHVADRVLLDLRQRLRRADILDRLGLVLILGADRVIPPGRGSTTLGLLLLGHGRRPRRADLLQRLDPGRGRPLGQFVQPDLPRVVAPERALLHQPHPALKEVRALARVPRRGL